jgi:hypothetical protein
MDYPNYDQCAESPLVGEDQCGIKALFPGGQTRTTFVQGSPWPVHGIFRGGTGLVQELGLQTQNYLLVVVTHRELADIRVANVSELGSRTQYQPPAPDGGLALSAMTGYFNIDLKTQVGLEDAQGKYWVTFQLGPYLSEVLEFEVVDRAIYVEDDDFGADPEYGADDDFGADEGTRLDTGIPFLPPKDES